MDVNRKDIFLLARKVFYKLSVVPFINSIIKIVSLSESLDFHSFTSP